MNATMQRLAGEMTDLTNKLNALAGMETATPQEAEHRSAEIARLTAELDTRSKAYEVEEASAAARAKVQARLDAVSAAGLVVPAKRSEPVQDIKPLPIMGELRGFDDPAIAHAVGRMLSDLGRGRRSEIRAASAHPIGVNTTLEPDSMGEKSPTYDGRGSELVAHELYRGILNVINYESIAARLATWVQVSTDGMYIPLGEDIQEADWYEENCEILPIKPNTSRGTLTLKKMGARVQVSNELMDDAYVSVAEVVTRTLGNAFAKKLDKTLIEGDAKIGFTGLAPSVTAQQTVTTAAAGKVTINEVAEVIGKVDPMASNRVWLVSEEAWPKIMGLAAGAIGVNITQGVQQTIFGSPVIRTALLPAKTYALYGDFQMAAAVGYKSGMTIRSSWERAIEFDQTVMVATARYAFAVLAAKYLAALKSA